MPIEFSFEDMQKYQLAWNEFVQVMKNYEIVKKLKVIKLKKLL